MGSLYEYQCSFLISHSILLRMKNISDKCCIENQNPYFMFSNFLFKNCAIYMWKNVAELQATDDNMVHVHCVLDTCGYKYIIKLCNTYCFSTATMVTRMCLHVTLYLHCLSCKYTLLHI